MIDHVALNVKDLAKSREFYQKALAPIGWAPGPEFPGGLGFVKDKAPAFWLGQRGEPARGVHVAFSCATHAQVDAFHAAALAAGGKDNGAPGIREVYHPHYYGAFVIDPDGNNIEAVCHAPQS